LGAGREMYRMAGSPSEPFRLAQQGIKEPLMCEDCEGIISGYEDYAKRLFRPGKLVLPTMANDGIVNRAEYRRFKLFQISLLWRAHVSKDPFFKAIDLGPKHGERLRRMLLDGDPGTTDDYPCAVLVTLLDGKQLTEYMQSPGARREGMHREFVIFYAGYAFQYLVASHKVHDAIPRAALQANGSFPITYWDLREFPNYLHVAREVALRNKPSVDRIKAYRAAKAKGTAKK